MTTQIQTDLVRTAELMRQAAATIDRQIEELQRLRQSNAGLMAYLDNHGLTSDALRWMRRTQHFRNSI